MVHSTELAQHPSPPATSGMLVAVLALLTAVAPLSVDMYLPAFPAMADELGTSATGIQLTMTTFMVGMALGQLFIGPLSDGIGRRRPLLLGTFICLVASVICALSPNVGVLMAARFLQGLSGAAGVVLARAIVSDTTRGAAAAKLLNILMVVSVIAPVIAPLAGGAIIVGIGWRGVFWVIAGLVLIMFLGALVVVKESLAVSERNSGGIAATLKGARGVLGNRNYVGYLLTFCFSFAGLFAYISASPFVIQNILGFSEGVYSVLFALSAVAITVTSAISAGLAGRVPARRMILLGLVLALLAALGLLASVLSGVPAVPTIVLCAVFQGSVGFIVGNATALALEQAGYNAGTGSAFLGFFQFTLGAAVSPLVGLWGEATALPMAVIMLSFAVLAVLSFWLLPSKENATSEVQ